MQSTEDLVIFRNARLVGHPEGIYTVVLQGGKVTRIGGAEIAEDGGQVVDIQGQWLSPVSFEKIVAQIANVNRVL
jgi:imidazolonepropionase-like amidohydrolase